MSVSALSGGTFRIMRQRNYALFWFGFLVSNAGSWIQSVAQGWLVYEISGSAVWLGAIGFIRAVPLILLSLVGGSVADRFPKRRILYLSQAVQMLTALILGWLTYTGTVQVWHVISLAALSASTQAFDQPTRHALVPSLVGKEDLHTAISLNAIAFNGAAVFGPSLTGILVPLVGLAGCFFINAASFASVFVALALMTFPPNNTERRMKGMTEDVVEGLRYVARRPVVLALLSMAAVMSFFARPYQQFITVFAKDVLHGDVGMAGLMQSAPALGTIIFMLLVASLGKIDWKGKMVVTAGIGFALSMIAFAWSRNAYLSLGLLVLVGGFNMTWQTTINTLLQTTSDEELRGRVMACYTITALGMQPLGQGPMGVTVASLGPSWALTLGAGIALLWVAYIAFARVTAVRTLP
jgi:MFS family permease